jgi:hypothetical protein
MTEDENKEFDLLQLADEMSYKNWMYFKFLYNKKFKEAEDRIKALEGSLAKYSCSCPYPCALYDAEKAKEDEMPHMMCGWWAKSVLESRNG